MARKFTKSPVAQVTPEHIDWKPLLAARDQLSQLDDTLANALVQVERGLTSLALGVPLEVSYETLAGRFFLRFSRHNGAWHLRHSAEADEGQPERLLASMSRHVRVEVWEQQGDVAPAMLRLLASATAQLQAMIAQRQQPVHTATLVASSLDALQQLLCAA